jgi:Arc/MetJ-type ribon-helix-helix transcriptional regulator
MARPRWYRRCMAASSTAPLGRHHRVAGGTRRPYKKISVVLPTELVDEIRAEVGPGSVSQLLTELLQERRRREALREWLDVMESTHGPISEEAVTEARRIWNEVE